MSCVREIVAYGPPATSPWHIPDFLVVKEGGILLKVGAGGSAGEEANLAALTSEGLVTKVPSMPWTVGQWLVVDDGSVRQMWGPEMKGWMESKSKELLHQAQSMSGDPERRVVLLRASAKLAGVPLDAVLEGLEGVRASPTDRLEELYKKVTVEK